jgi:lipoate-protein ligase A
MQNDNPNTERYIAIARACLKAINDTAQDNGTREEKIEAVYQAIDDAFQAEFSEHQQSISIMATVLERIANGVLSAEKAASLASQTLEQQPETARNSLVH